MKRYKLLVLLIIVCIVGSLNATNWYDDPEQHWEPGVLLVFLHAEVMMDSYIKDIKKKYRKYNLEIRDTITFGPAQSYYVVITFDEKKISEIDFSKILREDERVKTVVLNAKIVPR